MLKLLAKIFRPSRRAAEFGRRLTGTPAARAQFRIFTMFIFHTMGPVVKREEPECRGDGPLKILLPQGARGHNTRAPQTVAPKPLSTLTSQYWLIFIKNDLVGWNWQVFFAAGLLLMQKAYLCGSSHFGNTYFSGY